MVASGTDVQNASIFRTLTNHFGSIKLKQTKRGTGAYLNNCERMDGLLFEFGSVPSASREPSGESIELSKNVVGKELDNDPTVGSRSSPAKLV